MTKYKIKCFVSGYIYKYVEAEDMQAACKKVIEEHKQYGENFVIKSAMPVLESKDKKEFKSDTKRARTRNKKNR